MYLDRAVGVVFVEGTSGWEELVEENLEIHAEGTFSLP